MLWTRHSTLYETTMEGVLASCHLSPYKLNTASVRCLRPCVRLTIAALRSHQHLQLLETSGAAVRSQSQTLLPCHPALPMAPQMSCLTCPLSSLSASAFYLALYIICINISIPSTIHRHLLTHLAGPALWTRHALAKYFLQRFGAAASSLAASLLLLLPASAESTVVR